ncbi:MAG: ATP-binding protein [Betaproteobacteria bacterium]|nr:ATP-binding protein [Betaproteobacteria bacterium]
MERAQKAGWVCRAAQIPQKGKDKQDWNDLFQREKLTPEAIDETLYEGDLLLAKSAAEKGRLIYKRHGWSAFDFEFRSRLYWFKFEAGEFNEELKQLSEAHGAAKSSEDLRELALIKAGAVSEIANCYPTSLYYQANAMTDESWYYLRIDFPHAGAAVKNTFTGAQLSSSSEFKKRLLAVAPGAFFTGASHQLDRVLKSQLFNIKSVQVLDYIGYCKELACYVYNDVAVKDGHVFLLNDEDFYDMAKISIKSISGSGELQINHDLSEFRSEWIGLLWRSFGEKGVAALTFWFGALFAEQIRAEHKSFPFLEVVGEPGAGKTTLIEFLWKLLGRADYEGFDPSKSTLAARARNFAQVSNLPVVLIEGDRGEDTNKQKGFDWDELINPAIKYNNVI